MDQKYFIVVLAHSIHGRLRRIHVPYKLMYGILGLAAVGCFSLFGFVSSYARMAWKVANYNALRQETDALRTRYQNLQKVVTQTDQQLATLKLFASEVSVAYGIKQKLEGPTEIASEGRLVPTFSETLEDYNALRTPRVARFDRAYLRRWNTDIQPNLWPVEGRLMGAYGHRSDPFSGEGAYHKGVDISALMGTPVHTTADGTVVYASFFAGYGRLVIVDHGNGMETYYAHLSKFDVVEGQDVRRSEIVGRVGMTGKATAPHLHYEVRVGHAPVNPYRFLAGAAVAKAGLKSDFAF
jgi:murein DD-endopeptidase MepM/ murein hydrolase activator NlpD